MKKLILIVFITLLLISCGEKEEIKEKVESPVVKKVKVKEKEEKKVVKEEKKIELEKKPMFKDNIPFAIMIDNFDDARPQAGLQNAKLIYEAYVEGALTRLMILIDRQDITIGPIRSARPYFVDLMYEHRAFYAHVGGSTKAMDMLTNSKYRDFDQFHHGSDAYYRADHKYAPHNMYANLNQLYLSAENEGFNTKYNDNEKSYLSEYNFSKKYTDEKEISSVEINYDSYRNLVYSYDKDKKVYNKTIDGELLLDENSNEPVDLEGVLIQANPTYTHENGIHMIIETVGEGKAYYYTQGRKIELEWKKEDNESPTKYIYKGDEFSFNPGVNFINLISESMEITENE